MKKTAQTILSLDCLKKLEEHEPLTWEKFIKELKNPDFNITLTFSEVEAITDLLQIFRFDDIVDLKLLQ